MSVHIQYVLLIILSKAILVESLSYVPAFQITGKYIETGTYTLNEQYYYYGNSSWNGVQQLTFKLIFEREHFNHSQYHHSFQELHVKITPLNQINITIVGCGFKNTQNVVCLYSSQIIYIRYIRLRYIVLDVTQEKIQFITVKLEELSFLYVVTQFISTETVKNQSNHITEYKVICFFQGMDIASVDPNWQFDLAVECTHLGSNVITGQVIKSKITLRSITLAVIAYDLELARSSPFPAVSIELFDFIGDNSNDALFIDRQQNSQNQTVFWGLTRFHISSNSQFHFTSNYETYSQYKAIIGKSQYSFYILCFTVMVFKFKWCDTPVPYYLSANTTCYDVCPARYYEENTQSVCNLCVPYDCYKCLANGTCTVCSNSTDFRVLNAAGRCVAMDGYFDDGTNNPLAKPCDPNCKTCVTSAIQCTLCFSGYYLANLSQTCERCTGIFVKNTCQYQNIILLSQQQDVLFIVMISLIVLTAVSIFILQFCYRRLKNKQIIIQQVSASNQQI